MQLTIWKALLSDETRENFNDWLDQNVLGFRNYHGDTFFEGLQFYYPQIFLLLFVLIHVQKEIRIGIFDIPFETYETFVNGLFRYRLKSVCKTEAERSKLESDYLQDWAMRLNLDLQKDIDSYMNTIECCSEYEKYERSEASGDPIFKRENMLNKGTNDFIFVDKISMDGNVETVLEESSPDMVELP